jgi:small glutamine-rich tetratricopeptide repeat-containing protein alpha
MSQKDYLSALLSYMSGATLDPTNPIYYSKCSLAHFSLGKYSEAVEDANRAIKADPLFVEAYHHLG